MVSIRIGRKALRGWLAYGKVLPCSITLGIAASFTSAGGAYAQDAYAVAAVRGGELLSLSEAVRRTIDWHPSVEEAVARLRASEEAISVARAGYRPQISAGIGTGYDNLTYERERWRPRANISASQMLFDFGKVASSVDIAEAETRADTARVLLAVDSLVRDTSYAVIEIQRAVALLDVAAQQLKIIRDISELVDHRFRRGAATRSDALQALARVEGALASIKQIEAEEIRWRSNLAYLTGLEELPRVTANVPDWLGRSCTAGEPDWQAIPAMMQVAALRDEAEAQVRSAQAEGLPTVSFGAGTSTDINDPFSDRAQYNFGINVSSTLSSGGANKARTRGAAQSLRAADAAEASVRNEVGRLLAEAQRQVDSFDELYENLRAREANMEETGKLYRLQYLEMGTRTLVDLLNAQQELQEVRFQIVNTRHDLRRLNIDCLFNAGKERAAFDLAGAVVEGVRL